MHTLQGGWGTAWATLQAGPADVVLFLGKHVSLPPDRSQLCSFISTDGSSSPALS